MKKQNELLNAPSGPDQGQLFSLDPLSALQNLGNDGNVNKEEEKKNETITENCGNKIEEFRQLIEFYASKPFTSQYHTMFTEYELELDHKLRNIRLNRPNRSGKRIARNKGRVVRKKNMKRRKKKKP